VLAILDGTNLAPNRIILAEFPGGLGIVKSEEENE
jgi:hypothetical protein